MSPSRRDFLFTSAAAAAASLARVANLHAAQGPQAAPPVFTPIRRNVGFFTMRGGTIGYLINAGGVAVVDSPGDVDAISDSDIETNVGQGSGGGSGRRVRLGVLRDVPALECEDTTLAGLHHPASRIPWSSSRNGDPRAELQRLPAVGHPHGDLRQPRNVRRRRWICGGRSHARRRHVAVSRRQSLTAAHGGTAPTCAGVRSNTVLSHFREPVVSPNEPKAHRCEEA